MLSVGSEGVNEWIKENYKWIYSNYSSFLLSYVTEAWVTSFNTIEMAEYFKGKGVIDYILLPNDKKEPVIIIELKVDIKAESAIKQIQKKKYYNGVEEEGGTAEESASFDTRKDEDSELKLLG